MLLESLCLISYQQSPGPLPAVSLLALTDEPSPHCGSLGFVSGPPKREPPCPPPQVDWDRLWVGQRHGGQALIPAGEAMGTWGLVAALRSSVSDKE